MAAQGSASSMPSYRSSVGPTSGIHTVAQALEVVKAEFESLNGASSLLKRQNDEFDIHAASHSQEMSALRLTLTELEREHEKMKIQYEGENRRLRQELEAVRNGHPGPTEGANAIATLPPPPHVGHGPANLFGGIMGANSTSAPSNGNASTPQSLPGPVQTETNGWDRDREQLPYDHPAKRMRFEDAKPSREARAASGGSERAGTPNSSSGAKDAPSPSGPSPADARSGPLSISKQGGAGVLSAPDARSPGTPGSSGMDMEITRVSGDQKGSSDWITMFNPRAPRELAIELLFTLSHDSVVCCVKFSPDGSTLATGSNRHVVLYDTETGKVKTTLTESMPGKPDNYIRSACFDPTGHFLATGAEDRLIRVWDIQEERVVRTFEGHRSEIYSLAFSPNGQFLASGSGDRSAHVWNMKTGSLHMTLPVEEQASGEQSVDAGVTSVAISPDGAFVAAGSLDTGVRIWDLQTGKLLDRFKGHRDSVYSVAFSPDAKWLVSGSLDKTLKIWDIEPLRKTSDGSEAAKAACISTLSGHKDYVLSVAVSPDGQWIVSGSKDSGVSFWNPKATQAAVVLQGHKNSVISIAVSDAGGLLATGSGDWQARIWRLSKLESADGKA